MSYKRKYTVKIMLFIVLSSLFNILSATSATPASSFSEPEKLYRGDLKIIADKVEILKHDILMTIYSYIGKLTSPYDMAKELKNLRVSKESNAKAAMIAVNATYLSKLHTIQTTISSAGVRSIFPEQLKFLKQIAELFGSPQALKKTKYTEEEIFDRITKVFEVFQKEGKKRTVIS